MKGMNLSAPRALMLVVALALSACVAPTGQSPSVAQVESITPLPNLESWANWWMPRHEAKLAELRQRQASHQNVDLVFIGDSITHGWEEGGLNVWNRLYKQYKELDLGFAGDRTEHVLWRLQHGEIEGIHPKAAVLLIGTNNTSHRLEPASSTAAAIKRIIDELRQRLPDTKILLLAVYPRNDKPGTQVSRINDDINAIVPGFADNRKVFFLNINKALLNADGTFSKDIMPDLLHPNEKGYEIWAREMGPELQQLMQ
jgi:lysophospholipase L1-like esterase